MISRQDSFVEDIGNVSIIAITKNGINIGKRVRELFPSWKLYAPLKFRDSNDANVNWYSDSTSQKIKELFDTSDGIIALFSLGAVIRLLAPHIKDKKKDPAVIVIDDKAKFVISALSGHLGGANKLTEEIAKKFDATPVITTAADVNKTIPVDLVGREFGWIIDDDSNVTRVSAYMVNEEKIGIYQDTGERYWWKEKFPKNVSFYDSLEELERSGCAGRLIITDKILDGKYLKDAVVYRPKSLVVGIGLHWDTSKEKILKCLTETLDEYSLSVKSIAKFVSLKKPKDIQGLIDAAEELKIPVEYYQKEDLGTIKIPNPSDTVKRFEGTPSVSEAAALKGSGGDLVIEKQKFPPDLTLAVARIKN